MNKQTHIYTLAHPLTGEVRYVGKANDLTARLKHHVNRSADKVSHKRKWVNSLRNVGLMPKIEIVDIVDVDGWEFWEQHYIALFKSWGFRLVNATIGGDSNKGYIPTEATKEKLSIANIGKKHSEETKTKMSANHGKFWQGKKRSIEDREKFSIARTGKRVPDDVRKKMSESRMGENHHFFGKKLSEEHKAKLWLTRNREDSPSAKLNRSIAATKAWSKRKEVAA